MAYLQAVVECYMLGMPINGKLVLSHDPSVVRSPWTCSTYELCWTATPYNYMGITMYGHEQRTSVQVLHVTWLPTTKILRKNCVKFYVCSWQVFMNCKILLSPAILYTWKRLGIFVVLSVCSFSGQICVNKHDRWKSDHEFKGFKAQFSNI